MKLNLKAVIIAERLLNKPFSSFDLSDEETLRTLTYSIVGIIEQRYTKDEFDTLWASEKEKQIFLEFIGNEIAIVLQFQPEQPEEGAESGDPVWMRDIAKRLIISGMSEDYVLRQMYLWEIEGYLKAAEEKQREDMENARLWTFLSILPHVNSKKIKNPSDLIMFPWEVDEKKKKSLERMEQDKSLFEKFINSKK